MKRIFICFVFAIQCCMLGAQQNVGIGTTTPNSSALLELSSTTKGFLLPRMNSAQRAAIASPVEGLMVYDNTSGTSWIHNGGAWKESGSKWITNGANIYNGNNGFVGIGTNTPTERLHVATGNILISGSTPTLKFDDIGTVQAFGNDMRMLTATANSTGRISLRTGGQDRFVITNYASNASELQFRADGNHVGSLYAYSGGVIELSSTGAGAYIAINNEIYAENNAVGIGYQYPQERLDIGSGNVRLNNGNLLLENGNITMSNTNPIIQFENAGVEKGFVQVSGDNLRMGTNSGNTAGKFIIRNNGGDRVFVNGSGEVGINVADPLAYLHINSGASLATLRLQADVNPTMHFYKGTASTASLQVSGDDLRISAPGNNVVLNGLLYVDDVNNRVGINTSTPDNNLHVQGDMKVTTAKIYNNTGQNMLPIAWAKFGSSGSRLNGTSNITAEAINTSLGEEFRITVAGEDLSNAVFQVTSVSAFSTQSVYPVSGGPQAYVNFRSTISGDFIHQTFYIVIYK